MSPKFSGMFTLEQVPTEKNVVLIATGTGVAPYMSMIRTEVSEQIRRHFAVIHGARHSYDLGYHSELTTLDKLSERFSYFPVVSHTHEEKIPWGGHKGFVQDVWKSRILEKSWNMSITPENTHVFLCGNPNMVDDMMKLLEADGFKEHSKVEKF